MDSITAAARIIEAGCLNHRKRKETRLSFDMFGLFTTLAFAAAAAISQVRATLPANCDRDLTVAAGDTCNSISAQYNVSTYQLAAVNTGIIDADCDNLYVGEVICLGITGQDCQTTYVVQTGDTCTTIATQFNIPRSTLLTNNPNLNGLCTNLYPSEVLCVSSTIYVNLG